jgi:NAD-dependent dihydropyrimidine dehydrogenase PreA subunit
MKELTYLRNVVTLGLTPEKCKGCGTCLQVCPRAVLVMPNGKLEIRNRDACIECGACQRNCPFGAIHVKAGVGCAAAVINSFLGRKSACCSVLPSDDPSCGIGCC